MRVHISDQDFVANLLRFLRQRPDTIAAKAGGGIDVSILGSRHRDANRLELDLRLAGWRIAHPNVQVNVS
jgi:hypothetical protein